MWYPPHINAAINFIKQNKNVFDLVLLIIDSRVIKSSQNLHFVNSYLEKHYKILRIVTKIDLISLSDCSKIAKNKDYFCVNYQQKWKNKFINWLNSFLDNKKVFHKCLIIGMPNVGKSTFINKLCVRKKTIVSKMPGTTKHLKLIHFLNNVYFYDCPGIIEKNNIANNINYSLILANLVPPQNTNIEETLDYAFKYLRTHYFWTLKKLFPLLKITKNYLIEINWFELIAKNYFNYNDSLEKMSSNLENKINNWVWNKIISQKNILWDPINLK